MAQYIKVIQEPAGFKMFARLEKGAEPFPESQRDSYWAFDYYHGESRCRDFVHDHEEMTLECASKFIDFLEYKSDVDANGVLRLKADHILVKFGIHASATRFTPRKISVKAVENASSHIYHEYYFVEISAASAAKECPEILGWNAALAPTAPLAAETTETADVFARKETADISARSETTDMFARDEIALAREEITLLHEEIALLRKEIAVLHSEMDARQKRTDAIMAAAIHNLDEKISAK